jgi:hypothetical protein
MRITDPVRSCVAVSDRLITEIDRWFSVVSPRSPDTTDPFCNHVVADICELQSAFKRFTRYGIQLLKMTPGPTYTRRPASGYPRPGPD